MNERATADDVVTEKRISTIYLFAGALVEACNDIEAILVAEDKQLYQRNGAVFLKTPGCTRKVDAALLRMRAMQVAKFYMVKLGKKTTRREVDPPLKYFSALLRKGQWAFAMLENADAANE